MKTPSRLARYLTIILAITLSITAYAGKTTQSPPAISVYPSSITEGLVAVTLPIATISNLKGGSNYYIGVSGGYDSSANTSMGGFYTANSSGIIDFYFDRNDTVATYDDFAFSRNYGNSTTITLFEVTKRGDWKQVASRSVSINQAPGTASITPGAASPGTALTVTGSGASSGAGLTVTWHDATNCSCSLWGCDMCVWNENTATAKADASGNFTGTFTPPSNNNGFCKHNATIEETSTHRVVANTTFDICP